MEKNLDELTANDIATSLNNVFVAIGEFSGPIIGGYITTFFGFNYCCFFVSLIILLYFGIFTYYFYNQIINKVQDNEELLESGRDKEELKDTGWAEMNRGRWKCLELKLKSILESNKKRKI